MLAHAVTLLTQPAYPGSPAPVCAQSTAPADLDSDGSLRTQAPIGPQPAAQLGARLPSILGPPDGTAALTNPFIRSRPTPRGPQPAGSISATRPASCRTGRFDKAWPG